MRHVVLVGLMGSGKSTIGRRLAAAMNVPFVDTDTAVEAVSGRGIREIFAEDGEIVFRDLESRVLRDALSMETPSVIATGGGAVLRDVNRNLLSGHHVVWLRAEPTLLASRVGRQANKASGHRPLIDDDPLGRLTAMSVERRPLYESVSTIVVDVDDLSPDEIVGACRRAIAGSEA